MNVYPSLPLEDFPIDDVLARRLPRQLAYYHLALPIGVDEEGITVVMAQPENDKAREVIQNTLNAPIIPTKGDAEQIRAHLDRIWEVSFSVPWYDVLAANDDPVIQHYQSRLKKVFESQSSSLKANHEQHPLLVQRFSEAIPLNLTTSVLLVERIVDPIRRILHLVRLHTPDQVVMAGILPLAINDHTLVTLLPDTSRVSSNFAAFMDVDKSHGQHIEVLRQHLAKAGVEGELRLRSGAFVDVLRAELTAQTYDLVAVAADAYGEVVKMLTEIIRPYQIPAIMIIQPNLKTQN